jgi:hypothetical protein
MTDEKELTECAWCQSKLVPAEDGYCSKKCHDNDRKANEQ